MQIPSQLYRTSLALLTDLYELTMACAAWKEGIAEREAVFSVAFRRNPFEGGFTVAAGLDQVVDHIVHFGFEEDDLSYLAGLHDAAGDALFEPAFLELLSRIRFDCDLDAVPEGTVVFPHEPLLRVTGPVIPCMLLETAILAIINFQSLVATKAARVCLAAQGEPVLEFGLRRAQGVDGGLSASRAAYLGGCAGTSNVLAGKLFGIPVKGTHAHSWVMLFDGEREAFQAYARALPGNCVFLVDTYDTLAGVRNAIAVGQELRRQGKELLGIRLDSGDLAYLSIEARKLLDAAGFEKAVIYGSNELDEGIIASLKTQGAAIAAWGVGTRLVTGHPDAALGGVYKLNAVRAGPGAPWQDRLKRSEQAAKTSIPGMLQVRRFTHGGLLAADVLYDAEAGLPAQGLMIDPVDPIRRRRIPDGAPGEDLLVPVFRRGALVAARPSLEDARRKVKSELDRLHPGLKRFVNPHVHPVGLEGGLFERRMRLVLQGREPQV